MSIVSMARASSLEEVLEHALSLRGDVWIFDNKQSIIESLELLDNRSNTFNLKRRDWSIETVDSKIRFIAKPEDFEQFMWTYSGCQFQHVLWYGEFTDLLPKDQRQQCLLWVMSRLRA